MAEESPNTESENEEAEGSRKNVNVGDSQTGGDGDTDGIGTRSTPHRDAVNPMERGSGQKSEPQRPIRRPPDTEGSVDAENVGGIMNRPLDREREEQSQLPPRGRTKGDQ